MTRLGDLANKLSHEGRSDEIEHALEAVDPVCLKDAEREEWWHLYSITAFQDGRDDIALQRFQQGHAQFPDSDRIRFSLGQRYIRAKDVDKGFALFRETRFPDIPSEYALTAARYAYLYSRYEDGRSFIRPFFDACKVLKILDDNFLFMQGVPSFCRYWDHLAAFSILSGDWAELDDVTEYVCAKCSDYDFGELCVERDAYRSGDATRLLPTLRKRYEEHGAIPGMPTGFGRMRIAVIETRESPTLRAVRDVVERVVIAQNDFRWLEDVKTLTVAEGAHRFGELQVEEDCASAFRRSQALLFEPDIALEFWLLAAQERLKVVAT